MNLSLSLSLSVWDVPSVMRARLVSTLPSMNLTAARMMQARPLMMDTLNRKLS